MMSAAPNAENRSGEGRSSNVSQYTFSDLMLPSQRTDQQVSSAVKRFECGVDVEAALNWIAEYVTSLPQEVLCSAYLQISRRESPVSLSLCQTSSGHSPD